MTDFMGIHNVYDVKPILSKKDGMADGFEVFYKDDRSYTSKNGKWINKVVDCKKTVMVRDVVPEDDGEIHGFGHGAMVKRKVSKKVVREQKKSEALKRVYEGLKKLSVGK